MMKIHTGRHGLHVLRRLGRLIPAALLLLPATAFAAAAPAWKPDKAIELIAINAPGGGSDRILRIMAKIMTETKLAEVPVNIVNKPGGGGSVAFAYANQHAGNGHYIVMANKSLLTNNLVGLGPSYTDFTAVAKMFNEYIAVAVRPDSSLKSGREVIERLKKDPSSLSLGVATSFGNLNHQGIAAAFKDAGIDARKVRTAIFPSGGAATTALFGGHVDVAPITLAFAASLLRNNQVRILALTAPARLPGVLADVPTWREQGYDITVTNWRGFVGPKGLTPAQIAYWEGVLRRLSESEEWKAELETNFWSGEYLGSVDMLKFLERDNAQARTFLLDIGLVK
jgi:putative tricarboxylic transport membrane protein